MRSTATPQMSSPSRDWISPTSAMSASLPTGTATSKLPIELCSSILCSCWFFFLSSLAVFHVSPARLQCSGGPRPWPRSCATAPPSSAAPWQPPPCWLTPPPGIQSESASCKFREMHCCKLQLHGFSFEGILYYDFFVALFLRFTR